MVGFRGLTFEYSRRLRLYSLMPSIHDTFLSLFTKLCENNLSVTGFVKIFDQSGAGSGRREVAIVGLVGPGYFDQLLYNNGELKGHNLSPQFQIENQF